MRKNESEGEASPPAKKRPKLLDHYPPLSLSDITDESTHERHMNLTIRYDNDDCHQFGLLSLPNTTAATLHVVVKDLFLHCNLPLPLPMTSL